MFEFCASDFDPRPLMERGCSSDGWHRASLCLRDCSRVNTSSHTKHSLRLIGFVGKSPLVKSTMKGLPAIAMSSIIFGNLLIAPLVAPTFHRGTGQRYEH